METTNCVFCKIVSNEIPANIVYHDDSTTAFRDNNPQAPTHILIVPNQHVASLNELSGAADETIGRLFSVAAKLAAQEKVAQTGYRVVVNTGAGAGQSVFHLHLHLLGGRQMHWPPG